MWRWIIRVSTDTLEKDDKRSCTLNKWNAGWGGPVATKMEKTEALNSFLPKFSLAANCSFEPV